jgi:hypothetical protein
MIVAESVYVCVKLTINDIKTTVTKTIERGSSMQSLFSSTSLHSKSDNPSSILERRRSLSLWFIMKSFGHSHCAFALACTEVIDSLRRCRLLVLVNCLTACQATMRWLNSALVNSMGPTVVNWTENYQHNHHQSLFLNVE